MNLQILIHILCFLEYRFEPHLRIACKRFVTEQKPTFLSDDSPNKDINVAFYNLPLLKRYEIIQFRETEEDFIIHTVYFCFIQNKICTMQNRLRELTTAEIGKLVSVTGVVTRTSEVRPELLQGTFKCLECANVIKNVEQQYKYTEVDFAIPPFC